MADGNGGDRISISRDTLRAELGALELRLVDRLSTELKLKANQDVVDGLSARLGTLEALNPGAWLSEFRENQRDVDSLKAWRNRLAGATAALTALCVAGAAHIFFGF